VPTVVVFTQRDLKWARLHGRHSRGDVASGDSHQLTDALIQAHVLEWKAIIEAEETAGPDTTTKRGLRFAMLGGLTVYYRCYAVGVDDLLQECIKIRKRLHNSAEI